MDIKPIGQKLLILRDKPPSTYRTANGREIVLPASFNKADSMFGLVLDSGPDTVRKLTGKRVITPALGGQTIKDLDVRGDLLLIDEDAIFAIVEGS